MASATAPTETPETPESTGTSVTMPVPASGPSSAPACSGSMRLISAPVTRPL